MFTVTLLVIRKAVSSSRRTLLALCFPVDPRVIRLPARSALLSSRARLRQTHAALQIKHVKARILVGPLDVTSASLILRFDVLRFFLFISIRQLRTIGLGRRGS